MVLVVGIDQQIKGNEMAITVFEVITESYDDDKVVETRQYVTNTNNSLNEVAAYYTKECDELESELKSVRDVLSIVVHVPSTDKGE